MKTNNLSPKEMETYIARFEDLKPNKSRTGDDIPPEAREAMTARSTKTVIANIDAVNTPWGAGGTGGPIPGPQNFAVVIAECDPGNGPALHAHENTIETFTCIKGHFRIEWGDKGQYANKLGLYDTISIPSGIMRRFVNTSQETGLLYVILQGPLNDVVFSPDLGAELKDRFGEKIVSKLEDLGYSFTAGENK
ncbi:MAG: cupin domain-containing protein [Pseudomonadota bacterium]|nr:cupin domain-containing protein [Pseudomonadota bacterium]